MVEVELPELDACPGGRLGGVVTSRGTLHADATVIALGSEAALLLRPAGIDLPIYPVKGYVATFRIDTTTGGPIVRFGTK